MKDLLSNNRLQNLLMVSLLFSIAFLIHSPYISVFPAHVHAWAQIDRLALVLGYIENNFNLFQPQTFVLNHQFPNYWLSEDASSITAVDLPIHEYIVSLFVKITDCSVVYALRTYTIVLSIVGLFYLYKLNRLIGNNFAGALLVVMFTTTSPLYTYYQGGMLPSIACLSLSIVGLYYFIKYQKDKLNSDFLWSILFLTISALSRTSFAIPLIAVFCYKFFIPEGSYHIICFRLFVLR